MPFLCKFLYMLTSGSRTLTRLLAIPHSGFRDMLKKEYRMSLKVLWAFCETFSKRLRMTSQNMADLQAAPDFFFGPEPPE